MTDNPARRHAPKTVDDRVSRPDSWYEKPAFVKLQAVWEKKLKDDGFQDIEYRNQATGSKDLGYLKQHWIGTAQRVTNGAVSGGAEFYRMLGWWLHDAVFKSRRHRFYWMGQAEGMTAVELFHSILSLGFKKPADSAWMRKMQQDMKDHYK